MRTGISGADRGEAFSEGRRKELNHALIHFLARRGDRFGRAGLSGIRERDADGDASRFATESRAVSPKAALRRPVDSAACRCGAPRASDASTTSATAGIAKWAAAATPGPPAISSGKARYSPRATSTARTEGQRGSEGYAR